jgi:hypothetical protein
LCLAPVAAVGGDHFGSVFLRQALDELVRVPGIIAAEVFGEFVEKASGLLELPTSLQVVGQYLQGLFQFPSPHSLL